MSKTDRTANDLREWEEATTAIAANAADLPQAEVTRVALEALTRRAAQARHRPEASPVHQTAHHEADCRHPPRGEQAGHDPPVHGQAALRQQQRQAGRARRQAAPRPRPQSDRQAGAAAGHRTHPAGSFRDSHRTRRRRVVLVASFPGGRADKHAPFFCLSASTKSFPARRRSFPLR
jgi:hypothetical protein